MVAISDGATETTETFKRYFQRKVEVGYGKNVTENLYYMNSTWQFHRAMQRKT